MKALREGLKGPRGDIKETHKEDLNRLEWSELED